MTDKLIAIGAVLAPLIALAVLGILAILLVFHAVPPANEKYLIFILGALAGVVTTVGAQRMVARAVDGAAAPPAPGKDPV